MSTTDHPAYELPFTRNPLPHPSHRAIPPANLARTFQHRNFSASTSLQQLRIVSGPMQEPPRAVSPKPDYSSPPPNPQQQDYQHRSQLHDYPQQQPEQRHLAFATRHHHIQPKVEEPDVMSPFHFTTAPAHPYPSPRWEGRPTVGVHSWSAREPIQTSYFVPFTPQSAGANPYAPSAMPSHFHQSDVRHLRIPSTMQLVSQRSESFTQRVSTPFNAPGQPHGSVSMAMVLPNSMSTGIQWQSTWMELPDSPAHPTQSDDRRSSFASSSAKASEYDVADMDSDDEADMTVTAAAQSGVTSSSGHVNSGIYVQFARSSFSSIASSAGTSGVYAAAPSTAHMTGTSSDTPSSELASAPETEDEYLPKLRPRLTFRTGLTSTMLETKPVRKFAAKPAAKPTRKTTTIHRKKPTRPKAPSTRIPVPIPDLSLTKRTRGRLAVTDPALIDADIVHVCPIPTCGACFKRREHVQRHVRGIHTNEKPFHCDVRGCTKKFARGDNLKAHYIAIHQMQPPSVLVPHYENS